MSGWKLWAAIGMTVVYAVGGFMMNMHSAEKMIELIIGAMALLGIGHKIDKASTIPVTTALARAMSPVASKSKAKEMMDELMEEYMATEAAKKPEEPDI